MCEKLYEENRSFFEVPIGDFVGSESRFAFACDCLYDVFGCDCCCKWVFRK